MGLSGLFLAPRPGLCPADPSLRLCQIYLVGDFPYNAPGTPTWVFANGDTTGYSFHADFTMGCEPPSGRRLRLRCMADPFKPSRRWPTGPDSVLQQALDTCGLETGGDVNACAVFAPHMDYDSAAACKPEGAIVDEPNGWKTPLLNLPGDNPMWSDLSTIKV